VAVPVLKRTQKLWLLWERLLWGGRPRERALVWLLRGHYDSVFRRQWSRVDELPHFFDHRIGSFGVFTADDTPFPYYRGYYAAEVVREGDTLLDIGCGDGYFDSRFFGPRCATVDAIDIEASAIDHARAHNAHPTVEYAVRDAVELPFPREAYDVVVWDGALGHFPPETTSRMLAKIRSSLAPGGVFVGSESLGTEGHDHLQFFATVDDLGALFREHFPHVEVRAERYRLRSGLEREEAYWRCAVEPERLRGAAWRRYGEES
jgi:SAM-dependent methyltransferase